MRENVYKWLKVLLTCMFIMYMGEISFFVHTHVINGITIVHSHPFNNENSQDHTNTELELIHNLNTVSLTDDLFSFSIQNVTLVCFGEILYPITESVIPSDSQNNLFLRAPPVV